MPRAAGDDKMHLPTQALRAAACIMTAGCEAAARRCVGGW